MGLKDLVIKDNTIYLVEGVFDGLAFRKGGVFNCLSLCGLTLSEEQIEGLQKQAVKQIVLCLDNDLSGKVASANLKRILSKTGFMVKTVNLKGKVKDGNELLVLNKSKGKQVLINYLTF